MWAELRSIFERVSAEPAVRVVVLSSSLDKTWTVGLDCRCFSPRLSSEDAVVPKALCIARVACDHVVDSENSDGANRSSSAGTRSSSESLPASGSPPRACRSGSNTPTAPSRVMATAAYSSANRTSRIQRCKQPVIAAIHGNAVGLAIDIASACDVRLAASDVTFGIFVRPIRSSSSYSYLHMPLDLELVRYKRNTGRC
jgi:enoyl-CoA hydratase/carnithine racemase